MGLKKEVFINLINQFTSYKSLLLLLKQIMVNSNITRGKLLKSLLLFLCALFISTLLINHTEFNFVFNYITDLNLTISVGLIGLLIGGFSLVMSSITKETLYCLILYKDDTNNSFYRTTLYGCVEPLIWFFILLTITFSFKILYLIYPAITIPKYLISFIKISILTILIFITIIAINSLRVFILNMYNIFTAHTRFELMERYAQSTHQDLSVIINNLENELNNTN
mgnify:CR=1 FL=1